MPKYLIKRLIEKSGDDMKNETGKREKLIMSAIGLSVCLQNMVMTRSVSGRLQQMQVPTVR